MAKRLIEVDEVTGEMTDSRLTTMDVWELQRAAGKKVKNAIIAKNRKLDGKYVSKGYMMQFKNAMHLEIELGIGERYVWFTAKHLMVNEHEFVYLSPSHVSEFVNSMFGKKYTKSNISRFITSLCKRGFFGRTSQPSLFMVNPDITHIEKQHLLWTRYQFYDIFKSKEYRSDVIYIESIDDYVKNEFVKSFRTIREESMEHAFKTLTKNAIQMIQARENKVKSNQNGKG